MVFNDNGRTDASEAALLSAGKGLSNARIRYLAKSVGPHRS
jgi:hypothetical protein